MPELTEKQRAILDSALHDYALDCLKYAANASELGRMRRGWEQTSRQAEELYKLLGEAATIEVTP